MDYKNLDANLFLQTINRSLDSVKNYLYIWANNLQNFKVFEEIFGEEIDRDLAKTLTNNLQEQNFEDFPAVEIVSTAEIAGAKGAYAAATEKIYLSRELLQQGNVEDIAAVILEEYGHHLDSLLNPTDTPGDEGAYFSAVVRGERLTTEQLETIRVEDDSQVVVLNDRPVRIEQASFPYSKSGTTNRDRVSFDTGVTQGKIIVDFETYFVTDRVQILYEGKSIYDSNFIGTQGFKRAEANFSGDSTVVTVRMTPNLSNSGTAWEYIVNAELSECADTGALNVEPENGEPEDIDNDGLCEATGTVFVGRSDAGATSRLIRAEPSERENNQNPSVRAKLEQEKVQVNESVVYAAINSISAPLFQGTFTLPYDTPVISATFDEVNEEDSDIADEDFTMGGLEIVFNKLRLDRNQIELQGNFSLPGALDFIPLELTAPNALIINNDDIFFDGGGIDFPNTEEFQLFNALTLKAEAAKLNYLPLSDEIFIQGKFSLLTPLFKSNSPDNSGAGISLDVSGTGNYLRIREGQADLNGAFLIEDLVVADNFGIEQFRLALTTDGGDLIDAVGSLNIIFPWARVAGGIGEEAGIGATAGFLFPDTGIELDKIEIEFAGSQPIGTTGFFLQSISGGIENFAPSSQEDIKFTGSLGVTYGPQIDLDFDPSFLPLDGRFSGAALSLNITDAFITADSLGISEVTAEIVHPDVFNFTGNGDFSWEENNESFSVSGEYSALKNLLSGEGQLDYDFASQTLTALVGADLTFPFSSVYEVFQGKQAIGSRAFLKFSNDEDDTNDYIAAWGFVRQDPQAPIDVTEPTDVLGGFRFGFDSNFELFYGLPTDISDDVDEIQSAQSNSTSANLSSAPANSSPSATNNLALTSEPSEIFQPIPAAAANLPQFEETYEVSAGNGVIITSLHWDNSVVPEDVALQLLTPDGVIEEANFADYPDIYVARNDTGDGRKTVVVRDPAAGTWGLRASSTNGTELENVRTFLNEFPNDAAPSLEIIDVSPNAEGSEVTITYEANDPDTETEFSLYYETDNQGYDLSESQTIVLDLSENDGRGTYVWNTEGVAPGEYYVYGKIEDQFELPRFESNYSDPIVISGEADVAAAITTEVEEVSVGEEFTHTFTLTNNGEITANGLSLYASLGDVELLSASEPYTATEGEDTNLGDIVFEFDQLAPGATQEILVDVTAPQSTAENNAAYLLLSSETYDPVYDNNTDFVSLDLSETSPNLVVERNDLDLEAEQIDPKVYQTEAIDLGTLYSYEIAITNNGDAKATGVTLEENLADIDGNLGQVTITQGSYSYSNSDEILRVSLGEIEPGTTERVTVQLSAQGAGNRSSFTSVSYNESPYTEELTTVIPVNSVPVPPTDLELTQTVDNLNPTVGEEVNIVLNLINQGPEIASGIEITNLLPAQLGFFRANAASGRYDPDTGIWNVDTNMLSGEQTSLTITAIVEEAGEFDSRAEITNADQSDPDSTFDNGEASEDDLVAANFEATTSNNPLAADSNTFTTAEDELVTILAVELLGDNSVVDPGYSPGRGEVSNVTNGTATVNNDGNVEFTPAANFRGIASFEYFLSDGVRSATVFAEVEVKGFPIATNDSVSTDEDVSLTIEVAELLLNDRDRDTPDNLTVTAVDNAINGTAALNNDDTITFVPDPDYNGTASFNYTVTNGTESDTATVAVEIEAINDAGPVANDDIVTTEEDTPLTISAVEQLLNNDSDVDPEDVLTVSSVENAVNGSAVLQPDGNVEFIPDPDFNGIASFEYLVTDGIETTRASVEVKVTPVNDTPIATNDTLSTDEDIPLTIAAEDLLANDSDVDEDTLSLSSVDNATNGTVIFIDDGDVEFTPDANFYGIASFEYVVTDGVDSTTGLAQVSVASVNDTPVVTQPIPDITVGKNPATSVILLDDYFEDVEDGDNLYILATPTITSFKSNDNGNRFFDNFDVNANRELILDYADNFAGTAEISVRVTDFGGESAETTFNISVINNLPVAEADAFATDEDETLVIPAADLLANDSDEDTEDTLSIKRVGNAVDGTAIVNADGDIEFTPAADFNGATSFEYTLTDGIDETTGLVEVTVNSINDAPVAVEDTFATNEDTSVTMSVADLLANDSDVDNDTISFTSIESAVDGSVTLDEENNNIVFTPNADFDETASFEYTITDGMETAKGLVEIDITPINDPPVLINSIPDLTVSQNAPDTVIQLADYFEDVDNGRFNLGYSLSASSSFYGSTSGKFFDLFALNNTTKALTLGFDNEVIGTSTITLRVSDSGGETVETAFTVEVVEADDDTTTPNNDTITTDEDTPITISDAQLLANDTGENLSIESVGNAVNGSAVLNNDGDVEFVPDADFNGIASFDYVVNDGTTNRTAAVEVTVNPINDAPVLVTPIPDLTVTQSSPNSVIALADYFEDVENGDNLGFPSGYSASFSGGTTGKFFDLFAVDSSTNSLILDYAEDVIGTATVRVRATDGELESEEATFTVSVVEPTEESNNPPVLVSPLGTQTAIEDSQFSLVVTDNFSDPDEDDSLTYTATLADGSELPNWLSFDPNSQTLSGTPTNDDVGSLNLLLTVIDTEGATATDSFELVVENVNDAPTLETEISALTATEDELFEFVLPEATFSDIDAQDSLSYTATLSDGSVLPSWLNFDPTTRTFSGTPLDEDVGTLSLLVTATDNAGATESDTFELEVINVDEPIPAIRINAGGSVFTDTLGQQWSASTGFSGGRQYSRSSAIAQTEDDLLYRSEVFGSNMSYSTSVEDGVYDVTLKFAEIFFNEPNRRVFDVSLEDELVLDNLDLFVEAGGRYTALDKTFKTEVIDGSLDLQFSASVNNAKVSAIEIQPSTLDNAVNNAPIIDLNGNATGRSMGTPLVYASGVNSSIAVTNDLLRIFESDRATIDSATVTITNPQDGELESLNAVATDKIAVDYDPTSSTLTLSGTDTITNYEQVLRSVTYSNSAANPNTTLRELSFVVDDGASVNNLSQVATVTVDVLPVESDLAIRVNAGGSAYSDTLGQQWAASTGFSGGRGYSTRSGIAQTEDDLLYRSEVFGSNMSYSTSVEDGVYDVTLKFAEIFFNQANQRVFDVRLENELVLDDFDVFAEAGGRNIALERTFSVEVTDGAIDIDLLASINNAKISAIEIVPEFG